MKNLTKTICSLLAALIMITPLYAEPSKPKKQKSAEQEAREEAESDLYDEGTDSLDDHDYTRAISQFREVMKMRGEHQDASMYWIAWAQNKNGNRSDALATLLEFQKAFPNSRWMEDAKVLEVEVRQSSGMPVEPARVQDIDVKAMALQGLMNSDPERGVTVVEQILADPKQPSKLKEKAVFLLSQSGSSRAAELLSKFARDGSNKELQQRALRYLGIMGGETSRRLLADVYSSSNDIEVKRSILKSFMISGDKARLLALAKGESNPDLRAEAVRQLGVSGARNELAELYAAESTVEVKKNILQAMFVGGSADKLGEIARNEKNPELRATAIRNLGLTGGSRAGATLISIYETDSNGEVRHAVINALFLQGNAKGLVELARKERDPDLKKQIISKLSIMGSKDASDYLMELLRE